MCVYLGSGAVRFNQVSCERLSIGNKQLNIQFFTQCHTRQRGRMEICVGVDERFVETNWAVLDALSDLGILELMLFLVF